MTDRRSYIGGSLAPIICGMGYKSRLWAYMFLRGEVEEDDLSENQKVYWGTRIEDLIADEYAQRTGNKVRRRKKPVVHPKHSFLLGHVDREVVGGGLLECKNTSSFMRDEWGPTNTEVIPQSHWIQVHFYMLCAGAPWCDVAVLLGGNDFRVYRILRNHDIEAEIERILVEFWSNVQDAVPPEPETGSDLLLRHPQAVEDSQVVAGPEVVTAYRQLLAVRQSIKDSEAEEEKLKFTIQKAMGDAAVLLGPEGTLATWKNQTSTRLDTNAIKKSAPDIFARYSKTTESRTFRLKE